MEFAPITRRQALHRLGLLLGSAISAPVLSGVLGGCRAEPRGAAYVPQALSGPQFERVAVISDHIIPPTDTAGARGAGVPEFIDELLHGWMPEEDREGFLTGLDAVDARAQREHGAAFLELPAEQQFAMVAAMDEEAYAPAPEPEAEALSEDAIGSTQQGTANVQQREQQEVGGDPLAQPPPAEDSPAPGTDAFFRQLKELTLAGYYTSQVGMTEELKWLASPGRYDGDVPLSQVGRTWA